MKFRFLFDPDNRFENRDEIGTIIKGSTSEDNTPVTLEELLALVKSADEELASNKLSRKARLKKVWACALLRDFKYGNRKLKFLKGVGLNGLFIENYKSAEKIDSI